LEHFKQLFPFKDQQFYTILATCYPLCSL